MQHFSGFIAVKAYIRCDRSVAVGCLFALAMVDGHARVRFDKVSFIRVMT
ncbi:hypothetical protein TUM17387_33280 [Shewanella carassii]|uniref:Uncharacterized protein n=1 Tax=Shewanella carassii TaxID=1987584 RepID=A0ABQ1T5X2_9GAMM|nr:hypothetical protein TUM17387_33280 [Shewanella carassii]GGE83876.1 hypothetical protein GCM10011520_25380 [Shewanella carassii]